MSSYTKPLNMIDFKNGERPEEVRQEEQFMYKYLEQNQKTRASAGKEEEFDGEGSDISDFADQEMKAEMDRLQSGAGNVSDEEDLDVDYSDEDGDEPHDEDDFFDGADGLEDVQIGAEEDAEMDEGSDYGDEYDQEIEEEKEAKFKKDKGNKKTKDGEDMFASYEDFAHLLEEGAEKSEKKKDKKDKKPENKKRNFTSFDRAQKKYIK